MQNAACIGLKVAGMPQSKCCAVAELMWHPDRLSGAGVHLRIFPKHWRHFGDTICNVSCFQASEMAAVGGCIVLLLTELMAVMGRSIPCGVC